MKTQAILLLCIVACDAPCMAGNNAAWTWVSGANSDSLHGTYGTQGVPDTRNLPGAREYGVSWMDGSGNLWLFGGGGYSATAHGYLSDLWKFDGENWMWVGGSDSPSRRGVYGTKGVADAASMPGARHFGVSWIDASDNLWLFGGYGYAAGSSIGQLNDLWKFDGTNWTWVSGSNTTYQYGVYGAKGVAAPGNMPGTRSASISWTDASGNLWLLGGSGYASSSGGLLNDLWKFDGTNWTWVSGSNTTYQYGVYGSKGVADANNVPGARSDCISWIDGSGNLWLFGGYGSAASGSYGWLNDLWRFDGTNWTWISGSNSINQSGIYGTKSLAAPANVPGARYRSISWIDGSGNLWLFGGFGYVASGYGNLNDLWKFDGANWTWVSGSDVTSRFGVYGTMGVGDSNNVPGSRNGSISWMDADGNFWLFGGAGRATSGSGEGWLNDLWKFDGANWTWVSGSDSTGPYGVYDAKCITSPDNVPGTRWYSASSRNAGDNLWLFGGFGHCSGGPAYLNDLWRFDGTNWTWVSGSVSINQYGTYGTKGVGAPANVPGARYGSNLWIDASSNLWLFGGYGYATSSKTGRLNDLWRFDGTNWMWISGYNSISQWAIYGTKGIAGPSNRPGARVGSVSWIDGSGNLWLFGGEGHTNSSSTYGSLNDLWKFDGTNWTWVSGSNLMNQYGAYGTKGVAAPPNVPGSRYDSISWIDAGGNLWLFGGWGHSAASFGLLNDLWRFDGANWTWISGSDSPNQAGEYGTKGLAAPSNVPRARGGSASWIDHTGNLWLFGGYFSTPDGYYLLNDLWEFDGANWIWVSGSSSVDQCGVYGMKGVSVPSNVPGARRGSVSWMDSSGNLLLFGGNRLAANSGDCFNDIWRFGIPEEAADMTGDGVVDELDAMMLAGQWLSTPGEPSADLAPNPAGDGLVNFRDFAVLAGKWLDVF